MRKRRVDGFVLASLDLFMALVVTFMAMAVLAIISSEKKSEASIHASLVITQYWAKSADADVDTWMIGPDEAQPVGYSHKHGYHCDLDRDDRGHAVDPESRNMEYIICRGAPAGEYIINSVLYADYTNQLPIHVWITVQNGSGVQILRADGELDALRQEITLARFQLDTNGNLVPGSINRLQAHLYEAGQ